LAALRGKTNTELSPEIINMYNRINKLLNDFAKINGELGSIQGNLQSADVAPTDQCIAAVNKTHLALGKMLTQQFAAVKNDISDLNNQLIKAKLKTITE